MESSALKDGQESVDLTVWEDRIVSLSMVLCEQILKEEPP